MAEPLAITLLGPSGTTAGGRFLGLTSPPNVRIRVGFPVKESLFNAQGKGAGRAAQWRISPESMAAISAEQELPAKASKPTVIHRTAKLSPCGLYRYGLARWWTDGPRLLLCMANPSDGDHEKDDPTIRRCIGFARHYFFAGLEIVNVAAYRTPYPAALREAAAKGIDIIGPDNDAAIEAAAKRAANGGKIVVAWGASVSFGAKGRVPAFRGRDEVVLALLRKHGDVYRFDAPWLKIEVPHPLMLRADAKLVLHRGRA